MINGTDLLAAPLVDRFHSLNSIANVNRNASQDLRGDIAKYQKDRNKASNDITQTRIKASTALIKKLTPILEAYSKENSIKIIVQKKHIVMGSNEYDITKDILGLVNKKIKSIKID